MVCSPGLSPDFTPGKAAAGAVSARDRDAACRYHGQKEIPRGQQTEKVPEALRPSPRHLRNSTPPSPCLWEADTKLPWCPMHGKERPCITSSLLLMSLPLPAVSSPKAGRKHPFASFTEPVAPAAHCSISKRLAQHPEVRVPAS